MATRWILVTGGSRGIGRAIVEKLAHEYNVVFTWRKSEEESLEVIAACSALPGWVESYRCDGSQEEAVNVLAPELLAKHGSPYAIVHNAGMTLDGLHINQTTESWQNIIATNLNSVFYWNRQLLPEMIGQGEGVIVMMSSATGIKGNIGQTAYGASKSAMIGLGRSLSIELARFGIRVNCLLPGYIESDMTNAIPADKLSVIRKDIPMKRFGKPDEIASAAAFLIGDASTYMTGQTLVLDGGLSA